MLDPYHGDLTKTVYARQYEAKQIHEKLKNKLSVKLDRLGEFSKTINQNADKRRRLYTGASMDREYREVRDRIANIALSKGDDQALEFIRKNEFAFKAYIAGDPLQSGISESTGRQHDKSLMTQHIPDIIELREFGWHTMDFAVNSLAKLDNTAKLFYDSKMADEAERLKQQAEAAKQK